MIDTQAGVLLGAVAGGFRKDKNVLAIREPAREELVARAEVEDLAVCAGGQVDEVELAARGMVVTTAVEQVRALTVEDGHAVVRHCRAGQHVPLAVVQVMAVDPGGFLGFIAGKVIVGAIINEASCLR